jgi:hypothetical protein
MPQVLRDSTITTATRSVSPGFSLFLSRQSSSGVWLALEPALQGVVGPDCGAQGEGGGHDWPIVGIAEGTLSRFILEGCVDALIENDNVRLYGRKASFGQFYTDCWLEIAATDKRGDG